MTRLILDPELFQFGASSEEWMQRIQLLRQIVEFACQHFRDPFLDCYNGAPYYGFHGQPYVPPPVGIAGAPAVRNVYFRLMKNFVSVLMRGGQWVDLSNQPPAQCLLGSSTPQSVAFRPFLQYLAWLVTIPGANADSILLLSEWNQSQSPVLEVISNSNSQNFWVVYYPATDCHQVVWRFLSAPLNHNMFPRSDACKELNGAFQAEMKSNPSQKQNICEKYGRETASRNGYMEDKQLERKNPPHVVFAHCRRDYFLSVDTEHGGLEVFSNKVVNGSYEHLGEFNYSCDDNKTQPPKPQDHKLYP